MATIKAQVDQTDNGKTLLITDVTTWGDSSNTGVTAVVITILRGSTTYTVINETPAQPCANTSLSWEIPSTDVGYSTDAPFDDGMITITIAYTTSPSSNPLTAQVFLDWNVKYYDFNLVKNLPYKIADNQFAFNQDIQKSIVFNTLMKGYQYSAGVGQVTKANDILAIIENFKLENT